jgi:hypothetical protein
LKEFIAGGTFERSHIYVYIVRKSKGDKCHFLGFHIFEKKIMMTLVGQSLKPKSLIHFFQISDILVLVLDILRDSFMSYFCGILQEFEFENRKNSQTFIMLRKIL